MQNQRFMFKSVHDGLGKDLYCTNAFLLVQHTTIYCFNYTTISVYNSITVELYKHKYNYITTYLCNYMPMWLRSKQRAHHNRQKPSKLHGQAWPLALAKAASRVPGTCRSSPNPPGACMAAGANYGSDMLVSPLNKHQIITLSYVFLTFLLAIVFSTNPCHTRLGVSRHLPKKKIWK